MDKTINISGNNSGNIIFGDMNIITISHTIPRILTPSLGNNENFVGRENELNAIKKKLHESNSLLLLSGIGGVGKSSLASYYLNTQKENFDYYGFIDVSQGIKVAFVSSLQDSLQLSEDLTIDDIFDEAISKLHNLEGKKLLVIDDIENITTQSSEIDILSTLTHSNFKILFTSRTQLRNIETYNLSILNIQDARELFILHSQKDDIEKIDKILHYVDCHTLFIILIAKTIANESYSLDDIIMKFENGELSNVGSLVEERDVERINNNLTQFFSMQHIDEEYIILLQQISILPSIEVDQKMLLEILQTTRGKLEFLASRGLIISKENNYQLHDIIKSYILHSYTPDFKTIQGVVEYFTAMIDNSSDPQTAINVKNSLIYFESIVKALKIFGIRNETVGNLFERLGNVYINLGKYQKALPLLEQTLALRMEILDKNYPSIASSYNNLANLYYSMGNLNAALSLYQKSLKMREEVLGGNHPDTATSYNNLAGLHESRGEYSKALKLYQKALKIRKEVLGENHPFTATSYNNLALLYNLMGEYAKALPLFDKALKIFEKVLGNHPDTAQGYNNLASLYDSIKEYEKALPLYEKALKIRENVLGENHPDTAMSYNDIAVFYYQQNKYVNALEYIQKAVNIFIKVLPPKHPNLINSQKALKIIKNSFNKDVNSEILEIIDRPLKLLEYSYLKLQDIQNQLNEANKLELVLNNLNITQKIYNNAIKFNNSDDENKIKLLAKRIEAEVIQNTHYYKFYFDNDFPLSIDDLIVFFSNETEIQDIQEELKEAKILKGKIILIIPPEETMSTLFENLTKDRKNLLIGLLPRDITKLLLSPNPKEVLANIISSQIALTQISPYQIGGGVNRESIFFGRDKIISHIINKGISNYIITGGRQVGKSSLLKAIERSYLEIADIECYYISASNANLIEDIKLQLGQEEESNKAFAKFINSSDNGYLFLIDEADDFVRYEKEHDYTNLKFMRSLSEKNNASFILAGFWEIYRYTYFDYQSPLKNFGAQIELEELEWEACIALATVPMRSLGLGYENEAIVESMITSVGQRANLIQKVCEYLIENISQTQRYITKNDISKALADKKLLELFQDWNNLSDNPKEQWIDRVLLYSTIEQDSFDDSDLQHTIKKYTLNINSNELDKSLARLRLGYIIKKEGDRYSYRVPIFRDWVLNNDIEARLESEIKKI